jgi:hypothetical protein
MADPKLFSLQGEVFLASRDANGKPVKPIWVGDATLTGALEMTTVDHNESFSGNRLLYGRLVTKKSANLTLTLFELLPSVLSLGLYAEPKDLVSGTVTAEAIPADLEAEDIVRLDHTFVSNLVLTDSSGTPKTLVAGTDYDLEFPAAGQLRIKNVTGYTQPIKAAYDYEATRVVPMFTSQPPERWLILNGKNTFNGDKVIVDLYRVQFTPTNDISLHHEEFGSFVLEGAALADPGKQEDPEFGPFGRFQFRNE